MVEAVTKKLDGVALNPEVQKMLFVKHRFFEGISTRGGSVWSMQDTT